jgi:hypothetical protein
VIRFFLMALVAFLVFRFLRRMLNPSRPGSAKRDAEPKARSSREKYPHAIDADFEDLHES